MIFEDFHVHSSFCDGKNTLEEMVRAAVDLNMTRIGFSGHAYMGFECEYCMTKEDTLRYAADISELKVKYKDKIKILCGLEMDYFSEEPQIETDYRIGSVHFVKSGENYLEVDNSAEIFVSDVKQYFDGDFYAYAKEYFVLVGGVIAKTKADIVGHFDLVTKFNEGGRFFDTANSEYVAAAKNAIDRLISFEKPFEVNTGAISRGYRKEAYPELQLLRYIAEKGGRVVLSSDSHSAETLCFEFEKYELLAKELGFADLQF